MRFSVSGFVVLYTKQFSLGVHSIQVLKRNCVTRWPWNGLNQQFNSPVILKLAGIIYDAPSVYLEVTYAAPTVYQALNFKYALTVFKHSLTGSSQMRETVIKYSTAQAVLW